MGQGRARPLLRAHHAGAAETGGEEWPLRVPPGKGFYFISTQAEESPLYGYQILPGLVYGFTWTGIELRGQLIATGLDGPHDWEAREDLVAAARELDRGPAALERRRPARRSPVADTGQPADVTRAAPLSS